MSPRFFRNLKPSAMNRMKNRWKPLLLSCAFLLVASCGQQEKQEQQPEPTRETAAPQQIISLETAREYYATYNQRRATLIRHYEDSINLAKGIKDSFPVARYVAFDYQVIKQYMAYIEQEAARAGADISTLRVYLSNNPDDPQFNHPRQNSVFLIPAVEVEGAQYGLYIDGDKPAYLSMDLQPWKPKGMGLNEQPGQRAEASFLPAAASLQGSKSLILNFGGSGPPPWN